MTLSLPPPTQPLVDNKKLIEEPWYRYWQNANSVLNAGQRTKLSANTTYYVATTGSNATGNGAQSSPWGTPQKAYDWIIANIDPAGYSVTISIAAGTYSADSLNTGQGPGPSVLFLKGGQYPGRLVVTGTSGVIFDISGGGYGIVCGAGVTDFTYSYIKFVGAVGSGIAVWAAAPITVYQGSGCEFGAMQIGIVSVLNAIVKSNSEIFTISGGMDVFWFLEGGQCDFEGQTITFSGTPAITTLAVVESVSMLNLLDNTYVGNFTGKPFDLQGGSAITEYGSNSIGSLGSTAGIVKPGGTWKQINGDFVVAGLGPLTSGTISGATLDINLSAYTEYRAFKFVLTGFQPATDSVDLWMRTSSNAGVSFDTGVSDYFYAAADLYDDATVLYKFSTGSAGAAQLKLVDGQDNGATKSCNGEIDLYNAASTSIHKHVKFQITADETSGNFECLVGGGKRASTSAVNAVRFMFSSGNIAAGSYAVYGLL